MVRFFTSPQGLILPSDLRDSPGASGDSLVATLASPDTDRVSLDAVLAAEGADVSRVLGDFHLLDLLSERSTISGAVFTGHADLCEVSVDIRYPRPSGIEDSLFVRFVILATKTEELLRVGEIEGRRQQYAQSSSRG